MMILFQAQIPEKYRRANILLLWPFRVIKLKNPVQFSQHEAWIN
jgi:hypothetical protein